MSIEITIFLPNTPDIEEKIGRITHSAIIAGGEVRTRSILLPYEQNTTPPEPPQVGDVTSGENPQLGVWPPNDDSTPNPEGTTTRGAQARRQRR